MARGSTRAARRRSWAALQRRGEHLPYLDPAFAPPRCVKVGLGMDDICGAKNERENERIILRAKSRWTSISTRSPLNFTRAERLGCHDGDDGCCCEVGEWLIKLDGVFQKHSLEHLLSNGHFDGGCGRVSCESAEASSGTDRRTKPHNMAGEMCKQAG